MGIEFISIAGIVTVFLILFFISKSGKQFTIMLFTLLYAVVIIFLVVSEGFTVGLIKGLLLFGFLAALTWFGVKKSWADMAMAGASFDSKLTQKRYSRCGMCGKKMSYHRMPKNFNQLFFGGLTCKNCGAEFDIPFDEFTS